MKAIVFGAFSLLVSLGIASAGAPEGKNLFAARCQPCHGANGEGKPAIAKMFNVTMHPLGSKEVQAKPDAEFKKIITAGQGKMKPVAGVTAEQVDDLIAFVRTLRP